MTVRWLTYLAPGIPARLFEALAARARRVAGDDVALRYITSRSGPWPGERHRFAGGDTDLAFVCAPSYAWSTGGPSPPVALLGVAWVPADPRSGGRPVYVADVLTTAAGPRTLPELRGHRVAYNDEVSLSGYHSLRHGLAAAGMAEASVQLVRSGSHHRSLALLRAGAVDAATVDATVWRRYRRTCPAAAREVRALATLGPYPVQPVVVRTGLPAATRDAMREALLGASTDPAVAPALADAELTGFAEVTEADYSSLRGSFEAQDGRSGSAVPSSCARMVTTVASSSSV